MIGHNSSILYYKFRIHFCTQFQLNAEENIRKQKEERRRTEWQPPTVESDDDDETDEELAKEEDLR